MWTLQCPWLKVLRLACDGEEEDDDKSWYNTYNMTGDGEKKKKKKKKKEAKERERKEIHLQVLYSLTS